MVRLTLLVPRQVRNRPRQQMQLLHRRLEQPLPRRIRLTKVAHLRRPHLRIAHHLRPAKTLQLSFSRLLHPRPNRRRVLGIAFIGQLLIINVRHFNMDINAIQQRTADPFLVAHNRGGRAATFPDRVAEEAAGAPVRVAVATNILSAPYAYLSSEMSRQTLKIVWDDLQMLSHFNLQAVEHTVISCRENIVDTTPPYLTSFPDIIFIKSSRVSDTSPNQPPRFILFPSVL